MAKSTVSDHASKDIEAHPVEPSNINLCLEKTATPSQRSIESHRSIPQNTLSRVLSRIRTSDSVPLAPPPDGGVRAWSTACLTSLVIFNSWGFVNSFGLFQTYYVNVMHLGENSAVSWIGSLQVFLVFGIGTFSGRALDAGFFKLVFWSGSIIYVFGLFMLSLCRTYWQVFLAHGVCMGIGYGLVFVPSIALTSTYFSHKKRGMALAVAVCGSSTGGMVFPAIAEQMLPTAGFPWTVRTIAFVQMATALVCAIFLKPRLPPRRTGPAIEWAAFKELPYTLYLISAYFFFWSIYIGFYYIGSFGRETLNTSQSTSINLLLVLNGVGIVARVVPNFVAEKVTGPLNLLLPYILVNGIILYCWIAVDSVTGLWVFAVTYGVFASGIHALFPVVLTSLTDDQKKLGVRSGMGFSIVGCAVLTGPPIAGALVQRANGSYVGLQVFAGTGMAVALVFGLASRWVKVGWKLHVKI